MAENIELTDDMPGELEQPQFPQMGRQYLGGLDVHITIDTDLQPGETITVLIRGYGDADIGPMIENTANVSSTTPDRIYSIIRCRKKHR